MEQLLILDGHAILYRSFFANTGLSTSTGIPTNAVYGFLNSFLNILKVFSDARYVAVAFDCAHKTFRNDLYPEYKSERTRMSDDLSVQIQYVFESLEALSISTFSLQGYEADDIIGTLVTLTSHAGFSSVIISSDKDLFQLVGNGVRMYDPWKRVHYNSKGVLRKLGVNPNQVCDYLALVGDTSDGVPGVPGIGPKTAIGLLKRFGTLDSILKVADDGLSRPLRLISEYADTARLAYKLVTIETAIPSLIDIDLSQLRLGIPDQRWFYDIMNKLEFRELPDRILDTIFGRLN